MFNYDGESAYQEFIRLKGKGVKRQCFCMGNIECGSWGKSGEPIKYSPTLLINKIIVVCHGIVMSSQTSIEDLIEHCGVRIINI